LGKPKTFRYAADGRNLPAQEPRNLQDAGNSPHGFVSDTVPDKLRSRYVVLLKTAGLPVFCEDAQTSGVVAKVKHLPHPKILTVSILCIGKTKNSVKPAHLAGRLA
jgi:hypothetical protein